MPEGDRFILVKFMVTPELLDSLVLRDKDCNLVTFDLGDPHADGFYTPVLTVHYDDNPLQKPCGADIFRKGEQDMKEKLRRKRKSA
jgi:hypothetical protein